jgi:hypothetical protein
MTTDISPSVDVIFGGRTAAQVLLYIENYGDAHGNQIARTFGIPASMVQRQLRRLEAGGIIVGRLVGRARLFTWNPRNPTARNLRLFLRAELDSMPEELLDRYFRQRNYPRRTGKPVDYVGRDSEPVARSERGSSGDRLG